MIWKAPSENRRAPVFVIYSVDYIFQADLLKSKEDVIRREGAFAIMKSGEIFHWNAAFRTRRLSK